MLWTEEQEQELQTLFEEYRDHDGSVNVVYTIFRPVFSHGIMSNFYCFWHEKQGFEHFPLEHTSSPGGTESFKEF